MTHVIGVTGQHEVLIVGLYTRDPAKVVFLNHFTGALHTKVGVRSKAISSRSGIMPVSGPCIDS